ncbi:hypothetical protein [Tuwongella immobilis]|uniref:DUF1573 domain-containing protein n=1 Tax=Tuwongella immobilis TaxID=692036 RepID=A0A6C2YVG2_9BACT|nr:hypothetical protein [Tuwongella immobilis]VIP05381.1 unnamed protein product [Tuwongella immobilis]VTS08118.1 unnamed protein product [Tuwongella immobilis]
MTWIIRILTAAALGTLLAAGWFLAQPAPTRTLEILNPHIELGEVDSGTSYEVTFIFQNDGDSSHLVYNLAPRCTPTCCFEPKQLQPQIIPPRSEFEYILVVKPTHPGPFQLRTHLFFEDSALRQEPVTISGVARDSEQ